jgi:hypothetical protein
MSNGEFALFLHAMIACSGADPFSFRTLPGAAVASHQGMHGGDDRPDEVSRDVHFFFRFFLRNLIVCGSELQITCTKCGLNQSEASALAEAKLAESQGYRTR